MTKVPRLYEWRCGVSNNDNGYFAAKHLMREGGHLRRII